jgi:hypothetical protein
MFIKNKNKKKKKKNNNNNKIIKINDELKNYKK